MKAERLREIVLMIESVPEVMKRIEKENLTDTATQKFLLIPVTHLAFCKFCWNFKEPTGITFSQGLKDRKPPPPFSEFFQVRDHALERKIVVHVAGIEAVDQPSSVGQLSVRTLSVTQWVWRLVYFQMVCRS